MENNKLKPLKLHVNLEVLQKYDQQGPRYTSYPPAPHFNSSFGSEEYQKEITETNQGNEQVPLSLYVHLPFCPARCFFCACNVLITKNRSRIQKHLQYLKKEILLVSKLLNPRRKVVQLHWGGGTPTFLSPDEIRDLYHFMKDHFNIGKNAEISIEIDPRGLTPEYLPLLKSLGFNRVSFGIQDFDPVVQKAVNRIQPTELNNEVVTTSRKLNFDSVNIDLIYGLPYQTVKSFSKTIDHIVRMSPDRLAVFQYAHVPWLKPHQNVIPNEALPNTAERLGIKTMVIEQLLKAGYDYIGMDHFAKPEDSLSIALKNHTLHRNFQGYTTHSEAEIFAMGITAISQLQNVYAQNSKDEKSYCEKLDKGILPTNIGYRLNKDDQLRRFVITELMCKNRLFKEEVESKFKITFDTYFQSSLMKMKRFEENDLVEIFNDRIEVTDKGRLVSRNIAMAFDAYLEKASPGANTYSRTV